MGRNLLVSDKKCCTPVDFSMNFHSKHLIQGRSDSVIPECQRTMSTDLCLCRWAASWYTELFNPGHQTMLEKL